MAKKNPQLKDASVEEQYEIVHAGGGIVVHAHPFREESYIHEIRLYPEFVDAVEAINATHSSHKSKSHNDPAYDKRAIAYALEHHLPMTAGSDVHSTNILGGGMAFRKRLESYKELCDMILHGGDYILTNGDEFFDWSGKKQSAQVVG